MWNKVAKKVLFLYFNNIIHGQLVTITKHTIHNNNHLTYISIKVFSARVHSGFNIMNFLHCLINITEEDVKSADNAEYIRH